MLSGAPPVGCCALDPVIFGVLGQRCQVNSAAGSEISARRSQAAAAASAQASFAALRKARRVSRLIR